VSLRDRAFYFSISKTMKFNRDRYWAAIWEHMKFLGHIYTEMNWDELGSNLVHELSGMNIKSTYYDMTIEIELILT
jgi:hypothetical protein